MKDLLIYCNMGLGDAIIVNGLVRKLAGDRCVLFPCKRHNYESVAWMFHDHPNIRVMPVDGDEGAEEMILTYTTGSVRNTEIMRLGCTGPGWTTSEGFDQTFYRQAGVPFEQRWEGFHVERCPDEHITPPMDQFAFVHDDPKRGFNIRIRSRYSHLRTDGYDDPNIFKWRRIMEEAVELHCIPSSFSVLWDSLPAIKEQKLYLHGSARPGWDKHSYRKDWQLV